MSLWLGFGLLILYFVVIVALIPMVLKRLTSLPKEWVRKIQHIGFAMSIFIYLYAFDSWQDILIAALLFMVVAYVFLSLFERSKQYSKTVVERNMIGGELKQSLILATLSFMVLIIVFTEVFDAGNGTVIIAVMSWGVGDALAAILGKRFGKTRVEVGTFKSKKTFFGSNAMTLSVLIIVFVLSMVFFDYPIYLALLLALITAPVASAIELLTPDGFDTITVPLGVASIVYFLSSLFIYSGVIG